MTLYRDIKHRLKQSNHRNKKGPCERHIVPYFKDKPLNEITPADIRQWQAKILSSTLKDTYQRQIYNQLNAVLNLPYGTTDSRGTRAVSLAL